MKARFLFALACCALACLLCAGAARADVKYEFAARTMVRLQVRAASDAPEDQALKLKVRDAVRAEAVAITAGAASPEDAFARIKAARAKLQKVALIAARTNGFEGNVKLETAVVRFPLKIYGDLVVPPGEYRALRVTLGEGEGRNWWCVVYPDFCATDPMAAQALRQGEPIQFYSSIGEWISRRFRGDAP